jgi:protein TonB
MEFLRQWQRGRLAAGVAASVLLHLILVALAVGIRLPASRYEVKRGEPLIVELPKAPDSPPPGRPDAPASRPSRASASAAPSPPARVAAAKPAPMPTAPAQPAQRAPSVQRPQPAEPVQRATEPVPRTAEPVQRPQPAPAEPAPRVASAVATKPSDADVAVPPAAAATPAPEPAPLEHAAQPHAEHQVAALPPTAQPPARPDIRTALRRGAGGSGDGRGGIEGEPIPLDSTDPRYSDYLEQVRRRIKEKWGYPCEKNEQTRVCEYRSTQLIIEFGIAKSGELAFVTLMRTSGHSIYDDYALNAVKLASPFPPIPDTFSKKGVPIQASFHYVLQSSLTNILR